MKRLQENDIIFDCIPIEGEHSLMRAVSNTSGGFCFLITDYEQGITLFERESVLNLNIRDKLGHEKIPLTKKDDTSKWISYYDYVTDPRIIVPESISQRSVQRVPEQSQNNNRIQRIVNEYTDLFTTPHPQFEVYINENDCTTWKIIYVGEEDTFYHGKAWILYVVFGEEYPLKPPTVRFLSNIYHININTDGKICHEILTNAWQSETTMRTILDSIAVLIKYPNPLNALDSVKGSLFMENKDNYYAQVEEWTRKFGKTLEEIKDKL